VFFGDVGEHGIKIVHHFEAASKKECPETANPATWMLECLGDRDDRAGGDTSNYAVYYKSSELAKKNDADTAIHSQGQGIRALTEWIYVGLLSQYWALQKRALRSHWRNLPLNFARLNIFMFLGILFGLIYLDLNDTDYAGLVSRIASIFMTMTFCGVISCATGMPVVQRDRAVFYREITSGTYRPLPYSLALALVEVPYSMLGSTVFVVPFYFMSGLEHDPALFFKYLLTHFSMSLIFNYLGQLLGAALPNVIVAGILQGMCFSFLFLFGGVFIRAGNIPKGWRWFFQIDWVPKGIRANVLEQFRGRNGFTFNPTTQQPIAIKEFVSEYLDYSYGHYWQLMGWILLTIVILLTLTALSFQKIRHIRR